MELGSILLAALGIGLLIFIHELGHFLAARAAGVRVEVFSLGFGPRLCGRNWKGTDFRLSLVPFGGFVMVAGQDPTDRRYPARESLYSKTVSQRALFWSGGVVMNALFALIVFPLVFNAGVSFVAPVVGRVEFGSAAWEAGLARGDRLLAVAGKSMYSFENLTTEVALHGNHPLALLVRGADESERVVTATSHFDAAAGLYELGIGPAAVAHPPTLYIDARGAAARAGLLTGDHLLAVNGVKALGDTLGTALQALDGDTNTAVEFRVRRGEQELTILVEPVLRTEQSPPRIGVAALPRRVAGVRQGNAFVERLGLLRDDVVLAIDDQPFLAGDLTPVRAGPERLRVHVLRNGGVVVLEQRAAAIDRVALAENIALTNDDSLMLQPTPDGAARAAGLRSGDRVESIDGTAVDTWDAMRRAVESAGDKPLAMTVRRVRDRALSTLLDASQKDLAMDEVVAATITPRRHALYELGCTPRLAELREEIKATSFGDALRLGTVCSLDLVKQLYVTLKRLVTGDVGAKNLGGIIRISQVSYDAAQRGHSWFWYFLALLSVNLAFVNLLPIPVLDGGYLMFLLIEKVKGSPVSTRVLGYSQVVGLVFVLLLVLFVTYNDILRLL